MDHDHSTPMVVASTIQKQIANASASDHPVADDVVGALEGEEVCMLDRIDYEALLDGLEDHGYEEDKVG